MPSTNTLNRYAARSWHVPDHGDQPVRIVVADDSALFRTMLQTMLTEWGFEVSTVADGREALTAMSDSQGPLIAVLDWEMPGLNGIQVCKEIRQKETLEQPYLIIVTSKAQGADKVAALEAGADDYLGKPVNEDELRARIGVGVRTLKLQHHLIRSKHELRRALVETQELITSISSILIEIDENGKICRWNQAAEQTFMIPASRAVGCSFAEVGIQWDWPTVMDAVLRCDTQKTHIRLDEMTYDRPSGKKGFLEISLNPLVSESGNRWGILLLGADITEHKQMEAQLALAQKMESIGQLAAGIAHEINTPTQYVSDNLRFLQESFAAIQTALDALEELYHTVCTGTVNPSTMEQAKTALEAADLDYMREEIPTALKQSLEGAERVASIVRAMKDFSHPGLIEKKPTDLNKAIHSTVTISRNEWKYVADLVTDLDPALPLVPCLPGELNQVLLNLIVNAAHAIAEVVSPDGDQKGTITVSTRVDGEWIEIRVADTGPGIPPAIRNKIFDPFFTTKQVGKGTGQGLAIAHDVVVKKHGGQITFETEVNQGTTFIVRLPLHDGVHKKACS
ncbi:MAG: response regulator [Nitrospirae bacterium]|nr:MAG: response regulator [Nitrospirota bacterium]